MARELANAHSLCILGHCEAAAHEGLAWNEFRSTKPLELETTNEVFPSLVSSHPFCLLRCVGRGDGEVARQPLLKPMVLADLRGAGGREREGGRAMRGGTTEGRREKTCSSTTTHSPEECMANTLIQLQHTHTHAHARTHARTQTYMRKRVRAHTHGFSGLASGMVIRWMGSTVSMRGMRSEAAPER